jgi:hypothetical protein
MKALKTFVCILLLLSTTNSQNSLEFSWGTKINAFTRVGPPLSFLEDLRLGKQATTTFIVVPDPSFTNGEMLTALQYAANIWGHLIQSQQWYRLV